VVELLKQSGLDTPVMAGGIIPDADAAGLKAAGVREVMGPGTTTQEIIEAVRKLATERREIQHA
jgi:methylmalonyl-CoA mutase C-terminal domain/subunit